MLLTAVAAVLLAPSTVPSSIGCLPLAEQRDETPLSERLTEVFETRSAGQFVTALVAVDGEVVFEGASVSDSRSEEALGPDHLFDLGSVSKHVTSAAVLRLVDRGKLDLDESMEAIFRDVPESAHGVTVRHLLSHTAGLPKAVSLSDRAQADLEAAAEEILSARAPGPPGVSFAYSNAGYQLAAAVVEEIAGKPYESFVERELFRRARLKTATCVGGKAPKSKLAVRRVSGSRESDLADFPSGWGRTGTTGVLMSVRELHRWDRALAAGKVLESGSLDLWAQAGSGGYGLGWYVMTDGERGPRLQHGGSVEGFRAWLVRWPARSAMIGVLGDEGADVKMLGEALEAVLFPDSKRASAWMGFQPDVLDRVPNGWSIDSQHTWTWIAGEGQLHAFLASDRETSPPVSTYLYVDEDDALRWEAELRGLLDGLDRAAPGRHRVQVSEPVMADRGPWKKVVDLSPFAEPAGERSGSARFGLQRADGTPALAIELDAASLETFLAGLRSVLDD